MNESQDEEGEEERLPLRSPRTRGGRHRGQRRGRGLRTWGGSATGRRINRQLIQNAKESQDQTSHDENDENGSCQDDEPMQLEHSQSPSSSSSSLNGSSASSSSSSMDGSASSSSPSPVGESSINESDGMFSPFRSCPIHKSCFFVYFWRWGALRWQ